MNAQDLKNSILQLAVQGKLVEQRPEEGTAKELLAQIKSEKEQLIKDKKIKKEKPLPEIADEEIPFEIPESWEWVRLSLLTESLGDGIHGTPEFDTNGKYYFINGNNLVNGKVVYKEDTKRVNQIEYEKYKKPMNSNTVLMSINGTIGNIAYYNDEPVILGKSACYVALMKDVYMKYIRFFLASDYFLKYAVNSATQTTIKNVSLKAMRVVPVPLPPLSEQKRIVAKIEEILPYIEQYDKAYTKLETFNKKFPEDMKKSILQMAMQGKLVEQRPEEGTADELYEQIVTEKTRLIKEGMIKKEKPLAEISEDEIPFDIPESWKWVRWGNLSYSIQYGYNAPALEAGRIKMVRISDIQNNEVLWDTVPYCEISDAEIETYLLAPNDILFARTGGTVGKSYLVKEVPEDAVYAGYLIRTRYSELLSPQYMKFFMKSQLYWQQLRNGTIATAQPNCNGKTLGNMIIPLPPLAEQKRIVAKLEQMLPYCDRLIR